MTKKEFLMNKNCVKYDEETNEYILPMIFIPDTFECGGCKCCSGTCLSIEYVTIDEFLQKSENEMKLKEIKELKELLEREE